MADHLAEQAMNTKTSAQDQFVTAHPQLVEVAEFDIIVWQHTHTGGEGLIGFFSSEFSLPVSVATRSSLSTITIGAGLSTVFSVAK